MAGGKDYLTGGAPVSSACMDAPGRVEESQVRMLLHGLSEKDEICFLELMVRGPPGRERDWVGPEVVADFAESQKAGDFRIKDNSL